VIHAVENWYVPILHHRCDLDDSNSIMTGP
jgi:hypothetical protein